MAMSFEKFYNELATELEASGSPVPDKEFLKKRFFAQEPSFVDESLKAEYDENPQGEVSLQDYLGKRRKEIELEKASIPEIGLGERLNYADALRGGGIKSKAYNAMIGGLSGIAKGAGKFSDVMTKNVPGYEEGISSLIDKLNTASGQLKGMAYREKNPLIAEAMGSTGALSRGAANAAMLATELGIGPNVATALAPGIGTSGLAKSGLSKLATEVAADSPKLAKILGGASGAIGEGAPGLPSNVAANASIIEKLNPKRLLANVKENIISGANEPAIAASAKLSNINRGLAGISESREGARLAKELETRKAEELAETLASHQTPEERMGELQGPPPAFVPPARPKPEQAYVSEGRVSLPSSENLAKKASSLKYEDVPPEIKRLIPQGYDISAYENLRKGPSSRVFDESAQERIAAGMAEEEDVLPDAIRVMQYGGDLKKANEVASTQRIFEHARKSGVNVDKDFSSLQYIEDVFKGFSSKYGPDNVQAALENIKNQEGIDEDAILAKYSLSTIEKKIKAQKKLLEQHQTPETGTK